MRKQSLISSIFLLGCMFCYGNRLNVYETISIVGIGGSGSVYLVKNKNNGNRYAMKKISKSYVHQNNLYRQVQTERDILASNRSPYTLRLYEAFYDDINLYLITPFAGGGDLMNLIITYDIFPEEVARFYMAEILLGLENLHSRGITSRDLKFENVLIDETGHCIIADYGLAATNTIYADDYFQELIEGEKLRNQRRLSADVTAQQKARIRPGMGSHKRSQTMVPTVSRPVGKRKVAHQRKFRSKFGTLEYASYHLFTGEGYTSACDLWSLGIILFECTFGYSPFHADSDPQTLEKLMSFKGKLEIPEFIESENTNERPSNILVDLIHKLVCFQQYASTIQEIKNHPFFRHVDWETLRSQTPPFVPNVQNNGLEYFPVQELEYEKAKIIACESDQIMSNEIGDAAFANFEYKNF